MKPRRHVHVAPLAIPAPTEPLVRSSGLAAAFALCSLSEGANAVRNSRNQPIQEDPARSRRTPSHQALGPRGDKQDRSYEFTLSTKCSAATSASAKQLFRFTRDLLSVIAFAGGLGVIHPALGNVLRHREHAFLEVPMMELLPHNDDRRRPGRKTARPVALYFEACYDCENGSSRWLRWNIFSRPDEERLDCVARDITEAKSAADLAHRMGQMFSLSGDLFCVLDSRGHFELANPAFQKLLGFAPQRLVRTAFADLVHHRDRRTAAASLGALAKEKAVFFVARCGLGHKRVAWKAVAAPPEDSVYCVGRDVTDLRIIKKATAGAERSLIDIAQLSNDINNPLEAIVNLLFLLKSRQLPQRDQWRYIDLAQAQVFRIARILERMR
jgi:PAS domain S-box-containing protein